MTRLVPIAFAGWMALTTFPHQALADLRGDLIRDATTFVPASANPAYSRLIQGGPLEVIAGITGAEFHIPGVPSSIAMSPVPIPVHKVANGVEYWQVTGELSGYYDDELGTYVVIGPIGRDGKNHRHDVGAPHPRSGLPGAFFSLSIPAHGLNGGLIQVQPAGDAGFSWPAAPLAFNPVDPPLLLERGYSVFTFGAGGTVPIGDDGNGNPTFIDTNPNDASNVFWLFPFQTSFDDLSHFATYQHLATFDGKTERSLPSPTVIHFWDPCFDQDADGNCLAGPNALDFSQPEFAFYNLQTYPEIVSNTGMFAKNLLRHLRGPDAARWTMWLGWSGSGHNALLLNAGTRAGAFQQPRSVGPEVGGGNYVRWNDPGSGRRYDAFLVYAPAEEDTGFFGEVGFNAMVPWTEHPVNAPMAIVLGDADVTLPQAGPYDYANHVADALAARGQASRVNDFLRIYVLQGLPHQDHAQLYADLDRGPSDEDLWYDYEDVFPHPGAFNAEGRGLRVSAAYSHIVPITEPDTWDDFFHGDARTPRVSALHLALVERLRERSEHGRPLPVSRVHPSIFSDIGSISTDTTLPPLPDAGCDVDFDQFFASGFACAHGLTADAATPLVNLRDVDVEAFRAFATRNPLARSLEPIILPDVAAPLGIRFHFFDFTIEVPFTSAELAARYGSHAGYVATFAGAAARLVAEDLLDARLAADYVLAAARSDVLRRGHGWVFSVGSHGRGRNLHERPAHLIAGRWRRGGAPQFTVQH